MINPTNEITATNSHAVMAAELADVRQELRNVITAAKIFLPRLHDDDRIELLDVLIKAELKAK